MYIRTFFNLRYKEQLCDFSNDWAKTIPLRTGTIVPQTKWIVLFFLVALMPTVSNHLLLSPSPPLPYCYRVAATTMVAAAARVTIVLFFCLYRCFSYRQCNTHPPQ